MDNSILHITNGDSAADLMTDAGIEGVILPWRDILHEGPVPATINLSALSEVRAGFIFNSGWGSFNEILDSFRRRDQILQNFKEHTQLTLWFEHDLYDQLQILQILDYLATQDRSGTDINMICIADNYLGRLSTDEINSLYGTEQTVTDNQYRLAQKAWRAYRSPTPDAWQQLLHEDTSALPHLHDTVLRSLEEYPDNRTGLTKTQQHMLQLIQSGIHHAGRLFGASQQFEQHIFMGDTTFWHYLQQMIDAEPALVELPAGQKLTLPTNPQQQLNLTAYGHQVLAQQVNWLDSVIIDRWIGGVHLYKDQIWCWDASQQQLSRY